MSKYYWVNRVCVCCSEKLFDYNFGWDERGKLREVCINCSPVGRLKYHCSGCSKWELTASDFESDKQGKQFEICNRCRERNRKYKADNRESINTKKREQYQLNKVKIIESQKTSRANNIEKLTRKIECDCGGKYQYMAQAEHRRTKKHMKHMELIFDMFLRLGVWK